MWLLPAPRSASIPAACVSLARRRRSSVILGRDPRTEDDRARVRLRQSRPEELVCHSLAGSPGGSRRMVHHTDRDPRPGDAAFGHFRPRSSSPPFLSPRRLVMFATAWAPCLCASEARPSDRGIRCWGIRPRHLRYQPLVRRETVAAGRDFGSATTLHPGAGPASPDIASSGVSEGGTGLG